MATKQSGKKQPTLNLLLLKGNYYPADSADYDLLKRRNVLIYRIPSGSLPQLRSTALTQLDIQIKSFSEIWDRFVVNLEQELEGFGSFHAVSQHEFWLKVSEDRAPEVDKFFTKISKFVMRYCIRLTHDLSKKEGSLRYKLKFIYSEDINNSYAFQNVNITGDTIEIPLTTCLRMVFTQRVVDGTPALTVQVQDKHGLDWSDCLNRTGRLSEIPKEDFVKLASYFLNLS